MKKSILAAFLLLGGLLCSGLYAEESIEKLATPTGTLEGSLLVPETETPVPVALIISGSGPTDRNGNNPAMQNDSLKLLATALMENGIATLRYDKRGIGKSQKAGLNEVDLRFDHYVSDAKDWIAWLKKDERFSEVAVIGHSEGSLIGMIASQQQDVARFVSIAGPGQSADKTIRKQLSSQPKVVQDSAYPILDKLAQGETVDDVNPMLNSLFRPSVQPYMISWFKYDPSEVITRLRIPVLIIQGATDLQTSSEDSELLQKAKPDARKAIIQGMNHVLKDAPLDRGKNLQTYNQPELPINSEVVTVITDFINK